MANAAEAQKAEKAGLPGTCSADDVTACPPSQKLKHADLTGIFQQVEVSAASQNGSKKQPDPDATQFFRKLDAVPVDSSQEKDSPAAEEEGDTFTQLLLVLSKVRREELSFEALQPAPQAISPQPGEFTLLLSRSSLREPADTTEQRRAFSAHQTPPDAEASSENAFAESTKDNITDAVRAQGSFAALNNVSAVKPGSTAKYLLWLLLANWSLLLAALALIVGLLK